MVAEEVQAGRRCGRKRVCGGWEPGGSATRGIGVTGRGDLTRTGYDSLRICAPVTETLIQLCKFLPSPTSPPSHAPHESPPPPSTPPPHHHHSHLVAARMADLGEAGSLWNMFQPGSLGWVPWWGGSAASVMTTRGGGAGR